MSGSTEGGFDHLVYLRVFEGCDLRCRHCFIPSNPRRLSLEDVAAVPSKLAGRIPEGSRILVQWHGGEPTLAGAGFLSEAVSLLNRDGRWIWSHGIQTNLMSYGPEWRDLYRDAFGSKIGVSWDPGVRLPADGRLDGAAGVEARFWGNLERAVSDGLDPYLVMTLTRPLLERARDPMELFSFLASRGVRRAHVERLTRTGAARRNWDAIGLDNAEAAGGLARLMRAYALWREGAEGMGKDGLPSLSLSPFDGLVEAAGRLARGGKGGYGCWSGGCDSRYHTIDADGYKAGCTAITSEDGNPRAGNEILTIEEPSEARGRRTSICEGCRWRPICSSGCLASDIEDGSGECSGGRRLFAAAAALARRTDEGAGARAQTSVPR